MSNTMTVGEVVAAALDRLGVDHAFGVVSIHNMPMLDALARGNAIRFVMARGEAGAANMADGYARSAGRLGVVFTSTGPGAANAAGGLVEAATLYAMNDHDRHRIRAKTRMRIVCTFFPALTGDEVHDADGSL